MNTTKALEILHSKVYAKDWDEDYSEDYGTWIAD